MASESFMEIAPTVLAEARAGCGCTFVTCLEQAFDVEAGTWCVRATMVVVPCREDHLPVAREVASLGKPGPANSAVAEIAAEMTRRIAA